MIALISFILAVLALLLDDKEKAAKCKKVHVVISWVQIACLVLYFFVMLIAIALGC